MAARRRALGRWLPGYLTGFRRRDLPTSTAPVHLLLREANHYEPHLGAIDRVARGRIVRWTGIYPRLLGGFRDSDWRPPHHTFFYQSEGHRPELVDALAPLCRAGFGEVEGHLHHNRDTAANLRTTLLAARYCLAARHRMFARDRRSEQVRYGFVHGNWTRRPPPDAVTDSRPVRVVRPPSGSGTRHNTGRRPDPRATSSARRTRLLLRPRPGVASSVPRPAKSVHDPASLKRSRTPRCRWRRPATGRCRRCRSSTEAG